MKKNALITGACINTGVAIVEKFAAEGYDVVFTGRSEEKVRAAEAAYREHPDSGWSGPGRAYLRSMPVHHRV